MCITVDRLIRARYVARARDPRDGRRVALRITKSGARLRDQKSVLDSGLVRGMLARMTPVDRKVGLRGLELLARAADESVVVRRKVKV